MSEEILRVPWNELSLDPEEDLWCRDGKLFTGIAFDMDASGCRSEQEMKNGAHDGVGRAWYPDGGRWTERYFRRGLLFGLDRVWYENGQLNSEGTFEYGIRLAGK